MPPLSWSSKIALGAVVPAAVTALLLFVVARSESHRLAGERLREEMLRSARGMTRLLDGAGAIDDGLRARIRDMAAAAGRVTIVDEAGGVLFDTDEAYAGTLHNLDDRPEIVAARERGSGSATRIAGAPGSEHLFVAVRIPRSPLVVRIERETAALDASLALTSNRVGVAAAALAILAAVAAFLPVRRLARPVEDLVHAARTGVRVHPRGRDELGQLGEAYNALTERLGEALGAARAEALRLHTLLHGMNEGVIALDASERVYFVNGAARSILDVPVAVPAAGTPLYEIVRDPRVLGVVQAAMAGGRSSSAEVQLEGPPRRTLHVQATPLGPGGSGAIIVLRDLSQIRRLERMRSDFVSNVSHELRTPLASIAAAVETLGDAAARCDDDAGPRFLAIIARNVARLDALLSDILALSQLESQPEERPRSPVDLAQVARQGLEDQGPRARAAGVELSLRAEGPVVVDGDPHALRRIVDNLVVNAITYTMQGGAVEVATAVEEGDAVLRVRDTGIGIPASELDRIFERFYRVDKARSRSAGGTGLGLAIVKHAAKLHGGEVEVESKPGQGSTFTVRLPGVRLAPARADRDSAEAEGRRT